ncbi:hypothetical protein BDZ45DRAFT_425371 [Acephala macrosclerotiorum]|nr:hypothetical protein BDZ45DRAFT_425371 [Acephala macrosclerotiorum]
MKDKVVHDFSSQLGWSLETIESVDANHREMVRAPGIQQISEVLKSLSQEAKTSDTHFDPKFQDTQEYVPGPYTYTERFYVLDYHRGLSNIPQYHPGTCSWLLQDHRFKQWRVGTGSKIFWLHGHPGHGKSVFARYLVENLGPRRGFKNLLDTQSPEDPMMAFFLCSYRGEATTSTHSLLSSIIHQLLFEDPSLSVSFESKWKVIDKSVTESIWNLWKIISMIFSAIGSRTLFVVIDAIDELSRDQWAPFFENLKEIILSNHTDVRLVMTSRNEPDIEKKLLEMNVSHLDLGSAPSTRADILTFITDTVRTYGQQNSFSEQMTLHIIQELVARSDGMFLWARLAWQYFTDGVGSWTHGVLQIRLQDLRRLPPGMDVLYHRILMKVDKRLHAELLEVLKWILVSKRPLTIDEISIALALRDNPKKSGDIDARLSIRSFFLTHCPHLVKVANSGEITLIHQSFKDFLLQTKNINENEGQIRNVFHIDDPGEVEFRAGLDCLTYLGLEDFTSLKLSDLVSETYNYDFTANRNRLAVNVTFRAMMNIQSPSYILCGPWWQTRSATSGFRRNLLCGTCGTGS